MDKKSKIMLALLLLGIIIWLFGGVYTDPEFRNEKYFFIKNKPTLQWFFHSPVGSDDIDTKKLTKEEEHQQLMYEKYVSSKLFSFPITIYK